MNRSTVGQKNSATRKPSLKQKSIASFFTSSQTRKSQSSITKTQSSTTTMSTTITSKPKNVSNITNMKRNTTNFTEKKSTMSFTEKKNTTTLSRPVLSSYSRPKLNRASSSLFQSQGSFDEYDPDEELRKLMNAPKLNNFKSSQTMSSQSSLTRMPSIQRNNSSSLSDFGASSPIKVEHHLTQLDDNSFREVTNISTAARQLSFTSSQYDLPVTSTQSTDSGFPATSTQSSFSSSQPKSTNKRTHSLQGFNLNSSKRIKPLANNPRSSSTTQSSNTSKSPKMILKLTKEQKYVIDLIINKRENVFYTGSAGTGKSVILSNIVHHLQRIYGPESVAITASTGLAAATIGGITLHKWSHAGIGNRSADALARAVAKRRDAVMTWKNTKVLIIDEISMIDGNFLAKLEYIARYIRKSNKPFGGIQLVFTGDFFQLPPVQKHPAPGTVRTENGGGALFCFESEAWKRCIKHTILLTKVFRQQDNELIDILNCIRFGEIETKMIASIRKLEREVSYNDGIYPTEIYATRREVDQSNKRQLESLPGAPYRFDADDLAPQKKMELLDSAVMAEKTLILKEDAQVMMLKNREDVGIFNGTLGKVLFFSTPSIIRKFVELGHMSMDPETIEDMRLVSKAIHHKNIRESQSFIQDLNSRPSYHYGKLNEMVNFAMNEPVHEKVYPYVKWSLGKGNKYYYELVMPEPFPVDLPGEPTALQRTQLPIMLCWALSIHKAQGQTIPRLKVDLRNIFEAGQVYVALSRAVSKECLQVTNFNPKKIRSDDKVKEFYKQLKTLND